MSDWRPSITIIGAGGMGALFGAILQEGGLPVTLVDTNAAHVGAIRDRGLQIEGFGGERSVRIPATARADEIDHCDILLFQCKGHATCSAARAARRLVEGGAVAISFQNGLGNEEVLAEELGAANVLGGITTMAGHMLAPGRVRDFSRVPSYIGEMAGGVSERTERIAAALTLAGLETHASADIVGQIWKKLLGNIAMSAISGATDLTSAQALRVPALRATSLRALDEALAVATAVGISLDRDEALAGLEAITTPGGTGDNKSSLCVDLLERRPTEVDFIYGSVIARGREKAVPTPTLEALASIVKGLESHYLGQGERS
jgi:2-dehydropantoate 2-reductase